MRDPLEEDRYAQEQLEAEEARELRWTAFIEVILTFVTTDGWSGVLQAVASAMRDAEREVLSGDSHAAADSREVPSGL